MYNITNTNLIKKTFLFYYLYPFLFYINEKKKCFIEIFKITNYNNIFNFYIKSNNKIKNNNYNIITPYNIIYTNQIIFILIYLIYFIILSIKY